MGMVNSQSMNTAPVLRSGESLSTTVEALTDKNAKTFYHMVPGARFIMPDGLELRFLGGQFTTADPGIIAELNKVTDKPTSMIYGKKEAIALVKGAIASVAEEAADTAGKPAK